MKKNIGNREYCYMREYLLWSLVKVDIEYVLLENKKKNLKSIYFKIIKNDYCFYKL